MVQNINTDTDAPRNCPNCGKGAVAIIVDGDSQTTSLYADYACEVEREDMPESLGWVDKVTYIHAF